MIKLIILFLAINIYSGDKPEVKKIDEFVENAPQQQQLMHPDKLLDKINKSKEDVIPKKRSSFQNHDNPKPKIRSGTNRTHRDFTIYNFERLDEEISILREDNLYLTEEISSVREREKVYIEALEGLLLRSKRYDHFFTKWDDLKGSFKSLWAVGGGSFLTAVIGALGLWFNKKRKKKKGVNGK